MIKTRIIPCLQLVNNSLVKTVKFDNYKYIGDPINTVRIFNELEVDELCFLDIRATVEGRDPDIKLLEQIANECFMPMSYGGGIRKFETVKKILSIGFEKVVINSSIYSNPALIKKIVDSFGSQAIVGAVDFKRSFLKGYQVYTNSGNVRVSLNIIDWVQNLEHLGVGEILATSIDRDGTWSGYDISIIKKIADAVNIPVIANGGAGSVQHLAEVVEKGGASAVALGSMVVYQKKDMGVLINFPDINKLKDVFINN